ncbi:hypothetical protein CBL_08761 [Carabus blaptoides fortunei]
MRDSSCWKQEEEKGTAGGVNETACKMNEPRTYQPRDALRSPLTSPPEGVNLHRVDGAMPEFPSYLAPLYEVPLPNAYNVNSANISLRIHRGYPNHGTERICDCADLQSESDKGQLRSGTFSNCVDDCF